MAKTFKNLPSSDIAATNKRAPECDFFDLTDTLVTASNSEVFSNNSNTDNISLREITSKPSDISNTTVIRTKNKSVKITNNNHSNINNDNNTDNLNNTNVTLAKTVAAIMGGDARQTFVLSRSHLEQLRDYVHARRAGGDYAYSQKQAMQEALDLLFASTDPVAPRPDQARAREQQRRERIQQGRRSRA